MIDMVQPTLFIIVLVIVVHQSVILVGAEFCNTKTSSCVNGLRIEKPFWIDDGSLGEGCTNYLGFRVKCASDGTPVIKISNNLYTLLAFESAAPYSYSYGYSYRPMALYIRVREAAIIGQGCPHPQHNFSIGAYLTPSSDIKMIIFYNCSSPPPNIKAQEIQCLEYNHSAKHSYAFRDDEIPKGFNWYRNCEKNVLTYSDSSTNLVPSLQEGFRLRWSTPYTCADCKDSGGRCSSNETTGAIICYCPGGTKLFDQVCPYDYSDDYYYSTSRRKRVIIGVSAGVGSSIALMILLLVVYRKRIPTFYNLLVSRIRPFYNLLVSGIRPSYNLLVSYWRKKIRNPTNVEVFLENCGCLALQRYKYSDVMRMTNSFKETLGQGGYGSVFKGKLSDGRLVAVKLLNEAKGKGEDFINEVATIGRTNHINVVSLVGFCAGKNKHALVYEYMPNGSLERFIYNEKNSSTSSLLGQEKLYEISLGIARGLEYLHRGCNTRILHLDIKPHNILLDKDFCPKISDFGLAKLCPTRESLVSMVGARGTTGYIAPEVYCRNFGGVSHKSDVYSYGMMVLEMIGGRKNIDATVENMSEIYFPHWLYTRLERHNTVEKIEETGIEVSSGLFKDETMKKMIIVALWCIQPHPGDRPSMSKVVDMLEGNMNELQMPPNPFPDPSSISSATS